MKEILETSLTIEEYMEHHWIPLHLYSDLDSDTQQRVSDDFFYKVRYLFLKWSYADLLRNILNKYNIKCWN